MSETQTWTHILCYWISSRTFSTLRAGKATRSQMERMAEKYKSSSILKGGAYATDHIHTHPFVDRYEQTASASYTTVIWVTRKMRLLESARTVALVENHIQTVGSHSSSMDASGAEKYTAETRTAKIWGWVETTDSAKET